MHRQCGCTTDPVGRRDGARTHRLLRIIGRSRMAAGPAFRGAPTCVMQTPGRRIMKAILLRALVLLLAPAAVGGCCDDCDEKKECYSADSCYIYCEKLAPANCPGGLALGLGECVDRACAIYTANLHPDCVTAWSKYYDCRLGNPNICIEEQCENPALLPACAPTGG